MMLEARCTVMHAALAAANEARTCAERVGAHAGHGIEDLRQHLLSRATPGKWAVESHATTDRSQEEVALEVVREKIFRTFYDGEAAGKL
jgi:GTPase Era involved in 16S rRNA processing